jgi:hypothetical protein
MLMGMLMSHTLNLLAVISASERVFVKMSVERFSSMSCLIS